MRPSRTHFAAGALILVALVVLTVRDRSVITSDTLLLLEGVAAMDECLDSGSRPCPDVDKYPLLQHLPALTMKRAGLSREQAQEGLINVNLAAAALAFGLVAFAGARSRVRGGTELGILALLVSPLIWYANTGFGEALSAASILALVVAVGLRAPPPVTLFALVLAGLSKESALPFLLALAAAALIAGPREGRRPQWIALGLGSLGVVVATIGFNLFRYGSAHNSAYADEAQIGFTSIWWPAEFFVAHLAAPNVGLLFYWPVAVAVIAAVASAGRRAHPAPLAPVVIALVLAASFAIWWSPFGFVAWSARLMVPWVPALVALALLAATPAAARRLEGMVRSRASILAVGAVALLALVQLGALYKPLEVLAGPTSAEHACSRFGADGPFRLLEGERLAKEQHQDCLRWGAWKANRIGTSLEAFSGTRLLGALVYLLAIAALVASARARIAGRPSPES